MIESSALLTEAPVDEPSQPIDIELEGQTLEFEVPVEPPTFDANLAEAMDAGDLAQISSDLLSKYQGDKTSRRDWEKALVDGMDHLGFKPEERTIPWNNACGVFHPVLAEAVVRFQSNAIMETFPAAGPVRTKIIGDVTKEIQEQAARVEEDMNYQLTERMTEYRSETERMLLNLPIAGSAFRKVFYDPSKSRPVSIFVPAQDFVVPYGATSMETVERAAHVIRKTKNELRKLQVAGFYRDIEIGASQPMLNDVDRKGAEVSGIKPTALDDNDIVTVLEFHVDYDLPGFEDENGIALPYVITMVEETGDVLAVRRNWYESDPLRQRRQHFVHYQYMPGIGFYGLGLTHLIGGIAKSATSILRQLVDAGTLSNLPAGFKARGLRIKNDTTPLAPGEFRDADVMSGALKDNLLPLPFKEPSGVLFSLMNGMVEDGRRFASISDMDVGNANANTPVGTTLALMERSMKVMSAVQARIHAAQKVEYRLIATLIKDNFPTEPEQYGYDTGADPGIRKEDYSDKVDVIPVSDPNAATMSQRVVQYQAALELSKTDPDLYDRPELHRQMLGVLGLKNVEALVPNKDEIKPIDPVTENMNIITGKPIKAFIHQDHEAHIAIHMAAVQDPKISEIVGQSPQASAIMAAAESHIREHIAFQYRREMEKALGAPLPDPENPIPPEVEYQFSKPLADAAAKVLQKDVQEKNAQDANAKAQDPLVQIEMGKLEVQRDEVKRKTAKDQLDHQARLIELDIRAHQGESNRAEDRAVTKAQITADLAKAAAQLSHQEQRGQAQDYAEGVRLATDAARVRVERERIAAERRRNNAAQ